MYFWIWLIFRGEICFESAKVRTLWSQLWRRQINTDTADQLQLQYIGHRCSHRGVPSLGKKKIFFSKVHESALKDLQCSGLVIDTAESESTESYIYFFLQFFLRCFVSIKVKDTLKFLPRFSLQDPNSFVPILLIFLLQNFQAFYTKISAKSNPYSKMRQTGSSKLLSQKLGVKISWHCTLHSHKVFVFHPQNRSKISVKYWKA